VTDGFLLQPGEGTVADVRGLQIACKISGDRTPAGPTLLEFQVPPGASTGAHLHRSMEELFYVVAGEFELQIGDQTVPAGPGTFACVPPGVAHGFGNLGQQTATLLIAVSPGGMRFERYFSGLADILAGLSF
jgi:uncharacterized RmlC-like cupin family protein